MSDLLVHKNCRVSHYLATVS